MKLNDVARRAVGANNCRSGWFSRAGLCSAYLIYSLFAGLFLVLATPPFQTPDAVAHFYRATQISSGDLLGKKFAEKSGGAIDVAAIEFSDLYAPLAFHPEVKATDEMRQRSAQLRWSGNASEVGFPNTSIYPAYTYLPQALAILVGRASHLSVRGTYIATCVLDLLFSVVLTSLAIAIGRSTSILIFAIALLPSTLMIYSSVSQEVTVLPLCFLLIACVDRLAALRRLVTRRWAVLLVSLLSVCVSARPPYAGLLLILFYPGLHISSQNGRYGLASRLTLVAIAATASVIAVAAFGLTAWSNFGPSHSVTGQLNYLLHSPGSLHSLVVRTLRTNSVFYFDSFIGVLGWLDTHFNRDYYWAALVMLCMAFGAAVLDREEPAGDTLLARFMILLTFVSTAAMIFASLYLAWTPVGNGIVDGVQGRYFLAVVPLLALAIPTISWRKWEHASVLVSCRQAFLVCVTLFPLYTFTQLVTTVIDRFYLH